MELENLIHAYAVDTTHIYYKCPWCKKRKTIHKHGSCRNLLSRKEHRCSDCPNFDGGYYLVIDDDTVRGTVRNNRILKRSLPILERIHAKQIKRRMRFLAKQNENK